MKVVSHFFVVVSCLVLSTWAHANGVSAMRYPGESFKEAVIRNFPGRYSVHSFNLRASPQTAYSAAGDWSKIDFSAVPIYASKQEMVEAFERVRNERFLESPHDKTFMRRISWMYPDDGCFARAALANHKLESWNYKAPAKVFIFGNLNVKTSNSVYGSVSWWYHVAPIVYAEDGYYVLDAAINPKAPTPFEEWALTQVTDLADAQFSVCDTNTYQPYSDCAGPMNSDEPNGMADQPYYLAYEWERMGELSLDPLDVLGPNPPW